MRRSLTPCLDCGMPVRASRCVTCSEKRLAAMPQPQKISSHLRGYDYEWRKVRTLVLDRDGWVCYLCQKKLSGTDATVDHIIPISEDPSLRLVPNNLAACCRSCNSRRAGKK